MHLETGALDRVPSARKQKKARIAASLWKGWCRHQESNPGPTDYKSLILKFLEISWYFIILKNQ